MYLNSVKPMFFHVSIFKFFLVFFSRGKACITIKHTTYAKRRAITYLRETKWAIENTNSNCVRLESFLDCSLQLNISVKDTRSKVFSNLFYKSVWLTLISWIFKVKRMNKRLFKGGEILKFHDRPWSYLHSFFYKNQ